MAESQARGLMPLARIEPLCPVNIKTGNILIMKGKTRKTNPNNPN